MVCGDPSSVIRCAEIGAPLRVSQAAIHVFRHRQGAHLGASDSAGV